MMKTMPTMEKQETTRSVMAIACICSVVAPMIASDQGLGTDPTLEQYVGTRTQCQHRNLTLCMTANGFSLMRKGVEAEMVSVCEMVQPNQSLYQRRTLAKRNRRVVHKPDSASHI